MTYIKDNDLNPLPGLLKTIGEDVVKLIKSRTQDLQQELDSVRSKLAEKDERINELEKKSKEWEDRFSAASEQHKKELAKQREQYERELADMKKLMSNSGAAWDKLQGENEFLKGRLEELEEERRLWRIAEAERAAREQAEQAAAREERERLLRQLKDKEDQLAALLWRVSDLEVLRDNLQKSEAEQQARNAQLSEALEKAKAELADFHLDYRQTCYLLEVAEKNMAEIVKERNALKDTNLTLERRLEDAIARHNRAEANIERLRAELAKKDAEYAERSAELLEQLNVLTSRNKLLTRQLASSSEATEKMILQVVDLKRELSQNDPRRLQQLIEGLSHNLHEARTTARQRQEQNTLLSGKNEDLQSALGLLERDQTLERQFLPIMHGVPGPVGPARNLARSSSAAGGLQRRRTNPTSPEGS